MSLTAAGYEIVPAAASAAQVQAFRAALGEVSGAGQRGMLAEPLVAAWAHSAPVLALMQARIGEGARAVRAIFFDKNPGANWLVPWHQDLTIATMAKTEVPGYGPWSVKEGVPHVQPPQEVLEGMLTLRLHLDDCTEENGALQVLPGSHLQGRLEAGRIREWKEQRPAVLCEVPAGGALLMRPLLLHASGQSRSGGRRRVLHVEYAAEELAGGLRWNAQA